jgi:4'-phosphopantetheinyl transferase
MMKQPAMVADAKIPEQRSGETRTADPPLRDLVHVWLIPTDQPPPVLAKLATLLDDEERRRAASHRSAVQRARFVAAHGATRRIVAAQLGLDPGGFRWRRGEHGKPEPDVDADARISISTGSQLALVAVTHPRPPVAGSTPAPREVGIDIEPVVSDEEATRLADRFFPPDQAAYITAAREEGGVAGRFATLWCRKEACVKALGGRLTQGLGLAVQGEAPLVVRFPAAEYGSEHGSEPESVHRSVRGSDPRPRYESGTEYRVSDVPAPRLFRAAVALAGAAPYQLRCHLWSPFH